MVRVACVLCCCCVLLSAQQAPPGEGGKRVVEFRLTKDPDANERGWMTAYDGDGFDFEYFGTGRKSRVGWTDLVEADAHRLRIQLGLELTDEERLGLIDGQEIFFKGGGSQTGVLEWVDEGGRHWLHHDGVVLPYPAERIDRIEEIKVKEDEVYSEEEVYIRALERRPPRNAQEHVDLALHMFDIGNWEAAETHFNEAIALDPARADAIRPRLAAIRDIREDSESREYFAKAKARANLLGDFKGAVAMIRQHIEEHPASKRRGLLIVQEIEEKRVEKLQVAFHRVKAREYERRLENYLHRYKPDLETAMSWVTAELPGEIERAVRTRLDLTEEEYQQFRATKAHCAPHWASYRDGTFIISSRARKGASSAGHRQGDPEAWWHAFPDVDTRSSFLRAYGAERLPDLFEVVTVRPTACARCGGRGTVHVTSLRPVSDGRTEWDELCPRCFGCGQDRAVGYR